MRRVIIHVGPHKTGTTAMQRVFSQAYESLLEFGVCYPKTGQRNNGHHDLVDWLRDRPSPFDKASFLTEVSKSEVCFISSENFVHLKRQGLTRMRELVGDVEIEIVYYLRRLVDILPSYWQEQIKHGQTMSFTEFLANTVFAFSKVSPNRLDHFEQLRLLADVFGKSSLRLMGYDRIRTAEIDFASDLVSRFLNQDCANILPATTETNLSKDPSVTSLLRLTNTMWYQKTGRRATSELRIAILQGLTKSRFPWIDDFKNAHLNWRNPIEIESRNFTLTALQARILEEFGDQIADDRIATENAYMEPTKKTIMDVDFPLFDQNDLFTQIQSSLDEIELGRR